jgi:transcriptional regulator with XRE-family HTH domain
MARTVDGPSRSVNTGRAIPLTEAEQALKTARGGASLIAEAGTAADALVAAVKQAVRTLRTARGMKQGSLAAQVGVSTSTISRLEGADTPVDLGMLCEVLQALGVGLRCELRLDEVALDVAIRPEAGGAAATPGAGSAAALRRELAEIKARLTAVEQDLDRPAATIAPEADTDVIASPPPPPRLRRLSRVPRRRSDLATLTPDVVFRPSKAMIQRLHDEILTELERYGQEPLKAEISSIEEAFSRLRTAVGAAERKLGTAE